MSKQHNSQPIDFSQAFTALTGNEPFPWQRELFRRLVAGEGVAACTIPTGLGKTAVIAIWLIALAQYVKSGRVCARIPRRLVYVVNRRTVVDQSTGEAEKVRRRLNGEGELSDADRTALQELRELLAQVCAEKNGKVPAISTLRGQFADNQEWSADPARPAVICGTVDMIGSRLLFGGYRLGFKARPLHAGFLGQDALLVHDEAHLEPAFQKLLETIAMEQTNAERTGELAWPKLRAIALSATTRNGKPETGRVLDIDRDDYEHPVVAKRTFAPKACHLHLCADEKKELADKLVDLALQHKDSGAAILVFVRGVEDALSILGGLEKATPGHVAPLTGTMRGHERDELLKSNAVFRRFMAAADRPKGVVHENGTVYLVCTSAGEVGINISADHMVCDLSTLDSMVQRLGRVNRFGERSDTRVDIVQPIPSALDDTLPNPQRRATLALLNRLGGDASPKALASLLHSLSDGERVSAFAPEPVILHASDILLDAWSMTTIRGPMPGRPPVAPYLHGQADWEAPRTSVAWREEVGRITKELIQLDTDLPQSLLDDYPLKPHELLSDTAERVYRALDALAKRIGADCPIWVVNDRGTVDPMSVAELLNNEKKRVVRQIAECTILLPPEAGGLTRQGTLDGKAPHDGKHPHGYDIADLWIDENGFPRRHRLFTDQTQPADAPERMALIRTIDTDPNAGEFEPAEPEPQEENPEEPPRREHGRYWHWFSRPRDAEDATRASTSPVAWSTHTQEVVRRAELIVAALNLPAELQQAIVAAAEMHDLGKKREQWQRGIGNPNPTEWYAKPGKPADGPQWRPRRLSPYRHEFGALLDIRKARPEHFSRYRALTAEMQDVALHLIAAHHGYARPHFPAEATVDPSYSQGIADEEALEVMRRYARLQRRFGRWGLAYLESLLRAADWAASREPSEIGGTP